MRIFFATLMLVFGLGTAALADLLSQNRGQWEGQGVLASGFEWPIYVKFLSDRAEVYTPMTGARRSGPLISSPIT